MCQALEAYQIMTKPVFVHCSAWGRTGAVVWFLMENFR
jgi:protein tyrosine phosphatase